MEQDATLPTPPATGSDFEKLDPRYITVERLGWAITFLVALVISGVVLTIVYLAEDSSKTLWFTLLGVAIAILATITTGAVLMPRWDYEAKRLRLDDFGLEIHRGIFWKQRQLVPRSRIQHSDVSQGPLERRFGLGTIKLHTAGTHNATVTLSGLSHERAVALRDRLMLEDLPAVPEPTLLSEPSPSPEAFDFYD